MLLIDDLFSDPAIELCDNITFEDTDYYYPI